MAETLPEMPRFTVPVPTDNPHVLAAVEYLSTNRGEVITDGLARGQSYLEYVLEGAIRMKHEGWIKLTRRLMFFFIGLAVLNELVWRTQSTEAWVYFKTFGLTIAIFIFFMTQSSLFNTYGEEASDTDAS